MWLNYCFSINFKNVKGNCQIYLKPISCKSDETRNHLHHMPHALRFQKKTKTLHGIKDTTKKSPGIQFLRNSPVHIHTRAPRMGRRRRRGEAAHLHFYNESGAGHLRFQHSATSPRKIEFKHARPLSAKNGGLLIVTVKGRTLSPLSAKTVPVGMNENVSLKVLWLRCRSAMVVVVRGRF